VRQGASEHQHRLALEERAEDDGQIAPVHDQRFEHPAAIGSMAQHTWRSHAARSTVVESGRTAEIAWPTNVLERGRPSIARSAGETSSSRSPCRPHAEATGIAGNGVLDWVATFEKTRERGPISSRDGALTSGPLLAGRFSHQIAEELGPRVDFGST